MTAQLEQIAQAIVADGKGILAADESTGTIKKRFDSIGAESTEDTRRDYREMLFRSTDAMKTCISGVILYDEVATGSVTHRYPSSGVFVTLVLLYHIPCGGIGGTSPGCAGEQDSPAVAKDLIFDDGVVIVAIAA